MTRPSKDTPFNYDKIGRLGARLNTTLKLGMDWEDAAQEAITRGLEVLPQWKGDSNVNTFITRAVINHFINLNKKNKRQLECVNYNVDELEEALLVEVDGPEEILAQLEVFERFEKWLDNINDELKFIITQRVGNETAFADIAKELKQPVINVKVKLHRAIKAFKKDLGI